MTNEVAPEGCRWVCGACGKTSKDLYGEQAYSRGWDESCMLNAVLLAEENLVLSGSIVVRIKDDGRYDNNKTEEDQEGPEEKGFANKAS